MTKRTNCRLRRKPRNRKNKQDFKAPAIQTLHTANCYALAATIAEAIFAYGDEPGSPCKRLQFKGGDWPDKERDQGGICKSPLVILIAKQLESKEHIREIQKA